MSSVREMSAKELWAVPFRERWNEYTPCESVVLIPGDGRKLHDSGFRWTSMVACDGKENPICQIHSGDSIDLNGIGGDGREIEGYRPAKRIVWMMDCLPKSGFFRLWNMGSSLLCGVSLSSFDLYAIERVEEVSFEEEAVRA